MKLADRFSKLGTETAFAVAAEAGELRALQTLAKNSSIPLDMTPEQYKICGFRCEDIHLKGGLWNGRCCEISLA